MTARLLGAALAALGAAWLGLSAAARLRRRVGDLRAMADGLELLRRELCGLESPLPEVMEGLSRRARGPAGRLFGGCAQACGALASRPFGESWRALVLALEDFPPEGREALLPLGEILGRYEAGCQGEALERAQAALERALERAEEERGRLGRVYQALGLSGGAFLVILLL